MSDRDPAGLPPELGNLQLPEGELPDDLAVLGARLEAAAEREVVHRREKLRSWRNGVLAVFVATPLALAAAATDVAPSSEPVGQAARAAPSRLGIPDPSYAYVLEHVPDLSFATAAGRACVGDPDCRVPDRALMVPVRLRTLY
jgi:hypothetical protein